jgi:hypothetical protein
MNFRRCIECGISKELNENNFQPSFDKKQNKIYFKKKCRECEKISCREYHANNRDSILKRKKKYDDNHKDVKFEYRKEYNQKPESKKKNSKRALKRYYLNKHDPLYILRRRVSIAVNRQIKKQGNSKGRASILTYLPYTIQELKNHLESLFEDWMTWDNYGQYNVKTWDDDDPATWKWSIDHIIVQSDLPYSSMADENFRKCWALSNLRPLSAKQNNIDGARRTRHKKLGN